MTNEPEQHSIAPSVGQVLKSTRIERGLTIEAVAKNLRISKRSLIPLEEDSDDLVCDVYTVGFLRSYAQFLGLNAEDLIQKFKDQGTYPKTSPLAFPAPLPGRGMPSFRVLALTLVTLLLIIAAWEWFGYQESATSFQNEPVLVEAQLEEELVEKPPTPPELMPLVQQSVPERSSPEVSSLIETQMPAEEHLSQEGVLLKTTATTWIEVKDENGEMVLNRLFNPGETYEFKDPKNLVLKTGNAGGVSLKAGEKILSSLGKSGEVKSKISLDSEKWLEQAPDIH